MCVSVDKMKLKLTKRISIILLSAIFILQSCNDISKEVYGNWDVLEVYYKNEDISGINRESLVQASSSMRIDKGAKIIQLPTSSNKIETGRISTFTEEGSDFLKIYDSTDKRFNGIYKVKIEKLSSESNGKIEEFSLTLESDDVYIYAFKTNVRF
jgi:hypothetical protein